MSLEKVQELRAQIDKFLGNPKNETERAVALGGLSFPELTAIWRLTYELNENLQAYLSSSPANGFSKNGHGLTSPAPGVEGTTTNAASSRSGKGSFDISVDIKRD